MTADNRGSINIGLRNIVMGLLIILTLLFVWEIRGTLMLVFAAVILVVFFTMPVRLLMLRFDMKRPLAIVLSVIGFILLLALVMIWVFPPIAEQFAVLVNNRLPSGVEQLPEQITSSAEQLIEIFPFLEGIVNIISGLNFELTDEFLNQAAAQIVDALGRLGGSVLPAVGGLASAIFSVLVIFFLSMYLLATPKIYVDGIITLMPKWYRERTAVILARIDVTLRAWLKVTAISMLIVGIGTSFGLQLLGIDEAAALGLLAGLLSFVPNFGPIVSVVPAAVVAIAQAPIDVPPWSYVAGTVVIIYGLSFIQSQVAVPILASDRMNMPAILILLGQIIFGFFFGFLGLMLAVPLTACVTVLVDEIYIKDILGDADKSKTDENVSREAEAKNLMPEPS